MTAPTAGAPAAPGSPPRSTTVLLLRHGRSTANTTGVLAGRAPGVWLDEAGRAQAAAVRDRLAAVRVDRLVSSPADRCRQTLEPLAAALGVTIEEDQRLQEVDYGDWTGRALKDLAAEPLWRVVQQHPAAATFPGGESLAAVSARAVAAVRDLLSDPALPGDRVQSTDAGSAGPTTNPGGLTVLVCSHGDVIKAILADALGMHLDSFQRIVVAPASLSVIRYTALRPFVERINDTGDLEALSRRPGPAVVDAMHAGGGQPSAAGGNGSDAVPGGVPR